MRWNIKQLVNAAGLSFRRSDEYRWEYLSLNPVHADVLVNKQRSGQLVFEVLGGCTLMFCTHDWCSAVQIIVNGISRCEILYSETPGFKSVAIPAPPDALSRIVVRDAPMVPANSRGYEVWLAAIDLDETQPWMPRSYPIGKVCNLTNGECGVFLTLSSDTTIGATIVRDGIWARHDVDYFRSVLQPGMVALDVGANIGHHSVLFSSLVGPSGRVVSFEPQRIIYRLLTANIAINGCENTEVLQCCVGESEGLIHLYPINYEDHFNFGALGVDPDPEPRGAGKGEACRVATIDQLLAELPSPLERCDFIKMDVRSFELFALRGAERLLRQFRPILFLKVAPFWMSKFYDYREIYRFLGGLGYEILHPDDPSVPPGQIKEWSGERPQEWDIIARPTSGRD